MLNDFQLGNLTPKAELRHIAVRLGHQRDEGLPLLVDRHVRGLALPEPLGGGLVAWRSDNTPRLEIPRDDPAAGTAAGQRAKIDTTILRHAAGAWRGRDLRPYRVPPRDIGMQLGNRRVDRDPGRALRDEDPPERPGPGILQQQ